MQATFLQSLIRTNAEKIASKHAMHDMCVDNARFARARGNEQGMKEEFGQAHNYRKQLARLHTIQKALRAELDAYYRNERITRKVVLLKSLGGVLPAGFCNLTSIEQEAHVDIRIAAHKMKNFH